MDDLKDRVDVLNLALALKCASVMMDRMEKFPLAACRRSMEDMSILPEALREEMGIKCAVESVNLLLDTLAGFQAEMVKMNRAVKQLDDNEPIDQMINRYKAVMDAERMKGNM